MPLALIPGMVCGSWGKMLCQATAGSWAFLYQRYRCCFPVETSNMLHACWWGINQRTPTRPKSGAFCLFEPCCGLDTVKFRQARLSWITNPMPLGCASHQICRTWKCGWDLNQAVLGQKCSWQISVLPQFLLFFFHRVRMESSKIFVFVLSLLVTRCNRCTAWFC